METRIVRKLEKGEAMPPVSTWALLLGYGRHASKNAQHGSAGGKVTAINRRAVSDIRLKPHLETIKRMVADGKTINDISAAIGIHRSSVGRCIIRNNIRG